MTVEIEASCARCGRPCDEGASDFDLWNVVLCNGVITGLLCPSYQTSAEDVEAEVNALLTSYELDDGPSLSS